MPINLQNGHPVIETLKKFNIFVMDKKRSESQDIRPLEIGLINLMPNKIETELQFARLLSNTPLQINLDLITTSSHQSKNTSKEHLINFYKSIYDVKNKKYDGIIVTGAPVEKLDYEEVDYWDEMVDILDFCDKNSHSTLYICRAAMAGLYRFYCVDKFIKEKKIFGVFNHKIENTNSELIRGFDNSFNIPTSRYASIRKKDISNIENLSILAQNKITGPSIIEDRQKNSIFILGHLEYDPDSIHKEYLRDLDLNEDIVFPTNYYEKNDNNLKIKQTSWRTNASLLFSNWINYYVYQTVDYLNK